MPFFFSTRARLAGDETVRSVELHRLTISEDNRLTGVELGSAVGVAVENIEATGTINGRDPGAGEAEDFLQHRLENDPLDLGQEPLGRDLFAAGVLDPVKPGERTQTSPDSSDDQVGTRMPSVQRTSTRSRTIRSSSVRTCSS